MAGGAPVSAEQTGHWGARASAPELTVAAPTCEPHASQNPSAASTGSPHDEQLMFMSRSLA